MSQPFMSLGRRIYSRRLQLGLTQQEVASRSGISQPTIQSLECGRIKKTMHIMALAEALQEDPAYLLTGKRNVGLNLQQFTKKDYKKVILLSSEDVLKCAQDDSHFKNITRTIVMLSEKVQTREYTCGYRIADNRMVSVENPEKSLFKGDEVFAEWGKLPKHNDLVIALLNEEVKVGKYLIKGNDRFLVSYNIDFAPILIEDPDDIVAVIYYYQRTQHFT